MVDINKLRNEAENYAKSHPEKTSEYLDKAEGEAESRTGHRHDEQIEKGADAIGQRLGVGGTASDGPAGPDAGRRDPKAGQNESGA